MYELLDLTALRKAVQSLHIGAKHQGGTISTPK